MKTLKKFALILSAVMLISAFPAGSAFAEAKSEAPETITLSAGSVYQIKAKKASFKSDRKKTARVSDKGLVTAVKKGSAVISVKNAGKTKKLKIKVENPKGYKISQKSGSYSTLLKVRITAKKGCTVYYTTGKKFSRAKKINGGKRKDLLLKKDTAIKIYLLKKGEKAVIKKMNKSQGCQTYKYDMNLKPFKASDVKFTLKQNVYKNEDGKLTVTWRNGSKQNIMFGEEFSIEKYQNGKWIKTAMKDDVIFTSVGLELKPGYSWDRTYNINFYYDNLAPGRYRISAEYSVESESVQNPNGSRTINERTVYAEFTV